jgi:hypothetical protein
MELAREIGVRNLCFGLVAHNCNDVAKHPCCLVKF